MGNQKPFWKFLNSTSSKNKAELLLYGPISETSWWGDEVTPMQFANDLSDIGDVDELVIRINSGGGDVFAAHAIHNLIRSHKAKKTVIIDGLAASAATIIAMAGDVIQMPKNTVMMIHNPWTVALGDSKDLTKTAELLEVVKETIIATYKLKTSLSDEEISALMDEEKWMQAEEAVEKGFADEVLESFDVSASMNGSMLIMNSVEHDLSQFQTKPEFVKVNNEIKVENKATVKEEIQNMDIEKLKAQFPELYNQVRNEGKTEGVEEERTRIQDIENIAMPGNEAIVNKAKFETGISASDMAVEILKGQRTKNETMKTNIKNDAAKLGDIGPTGEATPGEGQSVEDYADSILNNMGLAKGGK